MKISKSLLSLLLSSLLLVACGGGGGGGGTNPPSEGDTNTNPRENTAPVANGGADQNVTTGTVVTLDGSASFDGDGDVLSYRWVVVSVPETSRVDSLAEIANPQFTPDVDGTYVFQLVVNDGSVDNAFNPDTDNVVVTASAVELEGVWEFSAPNCETVSATNSVSITTSTDGRSTMYATSIIRPGAFVSSPIVRSGSDLVLSRSVPIFLGIDIVDLSLIPLTTYGASIWGIANLAICPDTPIRAIKVEADTAPAAPSNGRVRQTGTSGSSIYWIDNADNETGYIIRRMGPGETEFSEIARLGQNMNTIDDSGLVESSQYFYEVVAYNSLGESTPVSMQLTTAALAVPPATPTNVVAEAGADSLSLSWTDNATDEDRYVVYTCESPDCSIRSPHFLPPNTTSTTITDLLPETTYLVEVCARHDINGTSCTDQVPFTTLAAVEPILAPTNLVALPSTTSITVNWTDNATNEPAYMLYFCEGAGCTPSYFVGLPPNYETYTFTGLTEGTDYTVRVCAANACAANAVSTRTTIAAPSNLGYSARLAVILYTVTLSWNDNSSVETGYRIEMATNALFTGATVVETGANITTRSFNNVPAGTYYVRIRALTDTGQSAYSPTLRITL